MATMPASAAAMRPGGVTVRDRPRAIYAAAVAAIALLGLWLGLVHGQWLGAEAGRFVATSGRLPMMLAGVLLAWMASAHQAPASRARLSWRMLTLGYACVVVGDVIWVILAARRGGNPQPSAADLFMLAFYPFVLAALAVLPRVLDGRRGLAEFALDAAIIATAGGLGLWHFVVGPQASSAPTQGGLLPVLLLAYSLGNFLAVIGIAMVLARLPAGPERLPYLLVAVSLIANLVGDMIYTAVTVGVSTLRPEHARLCWFVWALAFALAAGCARILPPLSERAGAVRWRPAFRHMPALSLLLAYAVLAPAILRRPDTAASILAGGFVLAALIAVRLVVSQRENERLQAAELAQAGAARIAALVERSSEAILVLGGDLGVRYASPAAQRLLRQPGASFDSNLHPEDRAPLRDAIAACREEQLRHATLVLRFGPGDGPWLITECTVSNLLGDAAVDGIVINVRDVTERHALEEQLRIQALRDPLTGLANRELFLQRLAEALRRADGATGRLAVAVFDLDRFKHVNDGLGHRIGDLVLQSTAMRIGAAVVRGDSAARLGGDEFGLLMTELRDTAETLARVERVRVALAQPIMADGHRIEPSACAGIAIAGPGAGVEGLLRNADIALQQARGEGGNHVELFREERHGRLVERLNLEQELPRLLGQDAFGLAVEPVVRVADRRLAGLAVRLAWRDPANAPAPIEVVQASARGAGLGALLGRWVLRAMHRELGPLLRDLPAARALAWGLRLDAAQLKDDAVHNDIAILLDRLQLPPGNLVVSIPEQALLPLSGSAAHVLARLRELGVHLALVEFGGAHAAFELLDALAFDGLGLDESLVERIDTGTRPAALARAAVGTGRALELSVLAPGVRRPRQLEMLAELECDFACGTCLGPTLPIAQAHDWLAAQLRAGEPPQLRHRRRR